MNQQLDDLITRKGNNRFRSGQSISAGVCFHKRRIFCQGEEGRDVRGWGERTVWKGRHQQVIELSSGLKGSCHSLGDEQEEKEASLHMKALARKAAKSNRRKKKGERRRRHTSFKMQGDGAERHQDQPGGTLSSKKGRGGNITISHPKVRWRTRGVDRQ